MALSMIMACKPLLTERLPKLVVDADLLADAIQVRREQFAPRLQRRQRADLLQGRALLQPRPALRGRSPFHGCLRTLQGCLQPGQIGDGGREPGSFGLIVGQLRLATGQLGSQALHTRPRVGDAVERGEQLAAVTGVERRQLLRPGPNRLMRSRIVTDLGQLGLGLRQLGAFGGRVVSGGQPGGHLGALPGDKELSRRPRSDLRR